MFAGLVVAVQGWLRPSPYATHLSSLMFVGGGILLHGLAEYGYAAPEHLIHDVTEAVRTAIPVASNDS